MAMRRLSTLANNVSPEHQKMNDDLFKYKQESEKEVLEDIGVIHHHNAEESGLQREEDRKVEDEATGSNASATLVPPSDLRKAPDDHKDVPEKHMAVKLAKVSNAARAA